MAFHPIVDRETDFLLLQSVQQWFEEARYVVDVVEQLDLSALERVYAGKGSDAHPAATLLALPIDGYATGTFSRRKIERATYDSRAFRYIACNRNPDHDTLANFRKRFSQAFESAFVQVLQASLENQLSKFGTVSLGGTEIHANASRHRARSYGRAEKIEAQLKAEVQERLKLAEAADRFQREQAEYASKLKARAKKDAERGKKSGRKGPKPAQAGPRADDQLNLTDEESRIMPVAGGDFEQSLNAQAVIDTESMLILASHLAQATNDKEQVEPMRQKVQANPEGLNQPQTWLADTGYCSEKDIIACVAAKVEPMIAVKRNEHHPHWCERFSEPEALSEGISPLEAMKHRLKTRAGGAAYALRKQTVEPVFGIIKSIMGFRQFLLRGLAKVTNEWTLICLAWNLKRMAGLRPQ